MRLVFWFASVFLMFSAAHYFDAGEYFIALTQVAGAVAALFAGMDS